MVSGGEGFRISRRRFVTEKHTAGCCPITPWLWPNIDDA
jgi:hypothetical protein